MPIIKSAKKRAKQTIARTKRLKSFRTRCLTVVKNIENLVTCGKTEEAKKKVPEAYKIIDTATKKNIIHKNTASRKKSLVQRLVNKVVS